MRSLTTGDDEDFKQLHVQAIVVRVEVATAVASVARITANRKVSRYWDCTLTNIDSIVDLWSVWEGNDEETIVQYLDFVAVPTNRDFIGGRLKHPDKSKLEQKVLKNAQNRGINVRARYIMRAIVMCTMIPSSKGPTVGIIITTAWQAELYPVSVLIN